MTVRGEPTWQPISALPTIAMLIDEGFRDARERYATLLEAQPKPHVLDDATIARVERVNANYKTVCTHYIQPSVTPTIAKLGLAALLEERGAVRNSIDLWTPYGGWIRSRGDAPYGYNVTRHVLDPLLMGKLDLPNVSPPAAAPGLALVGDAALASDPLWGVGCGRAFQSSDWLVEETAGALVGGGDLDARARRLPPRPPPPPRPHHFLISDIAATRRANPLERAMYRASVTDDRIYRVFEAIGARRRSPATLFAPRTLARLARAT